MRTQLSTTDHLTSIEDGIEQYII